MSPEMITAVVALITALATLLTQLRTLVELVRNSRTTQATHAVALSTRAKIDDITG